jgi:hypothetical protein
VSGTSWRSSAVSVRPLISASLSLIWQVRPSISASISASLCCGDCDGCSSECGDCNDCSSGGVGSKDSEAAGSSAALAILGPFSSVVLAIVGSCSSVGASRACASGGAEAGSDRAPSTAPSGTIGAGGVARVVFMRRGSVPVCACLAAGARVPACACPAAGARVPACACARVAASGCARDGACARVAASGCARDGACARVAASGCARDGACARALGCILSLGCIRGGSAAILG